MNARAVTVTLNPAIDQTVRLASLRPGHVHRARSSRDDAGGKGINVAACLADWGVPTAALGVLGGGNDGVFGALFSTRGMVDGCLRIPGSTRTNIKLVDEDNGETTDINLPGLALDDAALDAVSRRLGAFRWCCPAACRLDCRPMHGRDCRRRPPPPVRACCWTPAATHLWLH